MNELRVLFTAEDKGYRAGLADADGTKVGVEVPFTPFLTDDDYENLAGIPKIRWTCPMAARSPGRGGLKATSNDGATRSKTPCSRPRITATS